jgi:nucleoside-diphosphate-sugar epimerase
VVITGAGGFLGSRLVSALAPLADEVLGIDRLAPAPDAPRPRAYRHRTGVFAEHAQAAVDFLKAAPPERRLVFHLAGMADAGACRQNPRMAHAANVELTGSVLEALSAAGGGGVIFPSSGLVYGDRGERPFTEESPLIGDSVYAGTKIAAEKEIISRAQRGDVRGLILRLSNTYGRGISTETVTGRILAQAAAGRPIRVADESPVRDFIYSGDVIAALVKTADCLPAEGVETLNLSSGTATSIAELAALAAALFNLSHRSPETGRPAAAGRSYLVLSNEKLIRRTGWQPATSLAEGLRRSVMEMREHGRKET